MKFETFEAYVRKNLKGPYSFFNFIGSTGQAFIDALRHPYDIRWRETIYYLDLCGTKSLPIVLVICFLMGVILGFQAIVQLSKFGSEIFVADLVGFSVLKELGPFMVAMIATGRAGSAFAAEIGTMIADEEVNALSTMGISISRFLVLPKLFALLLALPILTCFGDIAGLLGGMAVCTSMGDVPVAAYYSRTVQVLTPLVFLQGISKSLCFAVIIALIGCYKGLQSTMDAQGVGRSATNAVVASIFAVVISDAVITILYSFMGR